MPTSADAQLPRDQSIGRFLTPEVLKYALELLVLLVIYREVRELRRHGGLLKKHREELLDSRPLFSTLYTGKEEIMKMAIRFTKEARQISALGTIASLANTEIGQDETIAAFQERSQNVSPLEAEYVSANRDAILSSRHFRRIIDWMPVRGSTASFREVLANVTFFIRALEYQGATALNVELYHNSEILRGEGDFHFRCSDLCVVLRAGGHGNPAANLAISITDTRVVREFERYFCSLIAQPTTRRISLEELRQMRDFLNRHDLDGLQTFIASISPVQQ